MTEIIFHPSAQQDIVRLVNFLMEADIDVALATFDIIHSGISPLKNHPEIGRPTEEDSLRELVISRGSTGYIALYEFDELRDLIIVLRVKHQREDGFD